MLTGVVNQREATITVEVRGPTGHRRQVAAVIDTGFNAFLCLPPTVVDQLDLPVVATSWTTLGDGSTVRLPVFEAVVIWDGRRRPVTILAADGGPLVGMALLDGSRLCVDVVADGRVTIEPLIGR